MADCRTGGVATIPNAYYDTIERQAKRAMRSLVTEFRRQDHHEGTKTVES